MKDYRPILWFICFAALIIGVMTMFVFLFPIFANGDDTEDYLLRACLLGDGRACLDHNAQEWIKWCSPEYLDEVYCMTGTHDPDFYDNGTDGK